MDFEKNKIKFGINSILRVLSMNLSFMLREYYFMKGLKIQ